MKSLPALFFRLVGANTTFRKAFVTFRRTFFTSFSFGLPSTIFFWPPFKFCACSSPRNAPPVLLNPPLPFPFPFSSLHLTTFERSALPNILVVVPRAKTGSFIINVTLITSCFANGPQSIFVFKKVFNDEGFAFTAAVSASAERDSPLSFSACRTIPRRLFPLRQGYMQ